MRTLIVTAADANFFPLLTGLLQSLQQWPQAFADIGVLDLGLSREQRAWVAQTARSIVEPGWDLPVSEAAMRANNPFYRAVTARPFLPRYFPGYDLYLWMDADTWVQESFALDMIVAAASDGRLAAVPETHPTYDYKNTHVAEWQRNSVKLYFGEEAVERGKWDSYINSGIFALRGDAPHWGVWAKWLEIGLENSSCKRFNDQGALNHAVWAENLPTTLLPARCNWMCHLAVPHYDPTRRLFCEPDRDAHPIGILHLTYKTKNFGIGADAKVAAGQRSLRYPGPKPPIKGSVTIENRTGLKGISF